MASIIHGEEEDEYTDLPFHNATCLSSLNIIITIHESLPHKENEYVNIIIMN
jgi:hypothetical protein